MTMGAHPWNLAAEFSPFRIDSVFSLKEAWRSHGGRWTKLKKMLVSHRGARCEICGSETVPLHAHEVWEYLEPADTGLDPEWVEETMSAWWAQVEKLHESIRPLLLRRRRPLAKALVDIQLLCQPCHVCKHSYDARYGRHWCEVNRASMEEFHAHYREAKAKWENAIVIAVYYSAFDELPDYKSFAEWEQRLRDEADAWHEDDWVHAENEMNDSGLIPAWLDK